MSAEESTAKAATLGLFWCATLGFAIGGPLPVRFPHRVVSLACPRPLRGLAAGVCGLPADDGSGTVRRRRLRCRSSAVLRVSHFALSRMGQMHEHAPGMCFGSPARRFQRPSRAGAPLERPGERPNVGPSFGSGSGCANSNGRAISRRYSANCRSRAARRPSLSVHAGCRQGLNGLLPLGLAGTFLQR